MEAHITSLISPEPQDLDDFLSLPANWVQNKTWFMAPDVHSKNPYEVWCFLLESTGLSILYIRACLYESYRESVDAYSSASHVITKRWWMNRCAYHLIDWILPQSRLTKLATALRLPTHTNRYDQAQIIKTYGWPEYKQITDVIAAYARHWIVYATKPNEHVDLGEIDL